MVKPAFQAGFMFTEQSVASVVVLMRAVLVGRAAVSPEASGREPSLSVSPFRCTDTSWWGAFLWCVP